MARACLILDFDGTILDTEGPVYQSWAELWEEQGHELPRQLWQGLIGTDAGFDPWLELQRRAGRPLEPTLRDRRRARCEDLQSAHDTRDGILDWLAEAERLGVPVGVASSSPTDWVDRHLRRLGVRQHFACLSCCDDTVPAKPDPTSYRLACDQLGADPSRSVAVEDSPHGVAAAVVTGLYTVAVPHGLTADLDLSAADLVVPSLDGLRLADVLARAHRRAVA